MDAFYASVELLRYPELKGRPVVIGGGRRHQPVQAEGATGPFPRCASYAGRGVVTTATYEARAFGVHSGMALMKSAALAPDAVLLPTDFDEYRKYSRLFKAAVREIAPHVEDRGIDEIYIDLTDVAGRIARTLARAASQAAACGRPPGSQLLDRHHAQQAAVEDLLRARQAGRHHDHRRRRHSRDGSGRCRPARSTASGPRRPRSSRRSASAPSASWQQPTRAGWWSTSAAATAPGCTRRRTAATIGPVVTYSEPKSISRETTFERDLHAVRDRETLTGIFTALCEQVGGGPAAQGLRRPHHRHQAALRQFRHRDPRPDARNGHRGRRSHPPRRRAVPEARAAGTAAAAARRAGRIARAPRGRASTRPPAVALGTARPASICSEVRPRAAHAILAPDR